MAPLLFGGCLRRDPRKVWEDDAFHLHALDGEGYRAIERSLLLPDLDLEVMTRFVRLDDQHEAARAYRDWLRTRVEAP